MRQATIPPTQQSASRSITKWLDWNYRCPNRTQRCERSNESNRSIPEGARRLSRSVRQGGDFDFRPQISSGGESFEASPVSYSNFHLVDLLWKCFSHIANTTSGRTANTGSFIERMSSFIVDMSNLYFRS